MIDLVIKAIEEPVPQNCGFLKNSKKQNFCIDLQTQNVFEFKQKETECHTENSFP